MQLTSTYNKNSILKKFNISSATLDNWIRNSIPHALNNNEYSLGVIEKFIKDNRKLESRANKKNSGNIEYPKELVKYLNNSEWVKDYICFIDGKDKTNIANEIIDLYRSRLTGVEPINNLAAIIPHNELYSYSVAYQILLDSGDKSKTGAYYTPKFIVQAIVESLVSKDKKFLEPCCGVGFYTIEYIIAYKNKFNCFPDGLIYSNEIDPISAEITRLNIINLTKDKMPNFTVTCGDGLTLPYNDIDLIITNPPYGIKYNYSEMKTTEIFSHFIHKTLSQYLSKNGLMNFILPYSVLSVEKHKEIRKYFLTKYTVENIKHYGKSFDGVFSDIVSLQIVNKKPRNNIIKMSNGENKEIPQLLFVKNDFKITHINEKDIEALEDYYSVPHCTLNDATFALGIVTGDNSSFVFNEVPSQSYKEIISGKEIYSGKIDYKEKKYILNNPSKYQQKPDMSLFLKKKIIYKFISKEIVSAVDTSGILTLNSANLIILKNGSGLEEEYVSAILNSKLINHIYKMKFGNPLKVLKKSIQELPIFIFSNEVNKKIVENYKKGLHADNDLIIEENVKKYIFTKK